VLNLFKDFTRLPFFALKLLCKFPGLGILLFNFGRYLVNFCVGLAYLCAKHIQPVKVIQIRAVLFWTVAAAGMFKASAPNRGKIVPKGIGEPELAVLYGVKVLYRVVHPFCVCFTGARGVCRACFTAAHRPKSHGRRGNYRKACKHPFFSIPFFHAKSFCNF